MKQSKTPLQKIANKTGIQALPAKKSFNKLVGQAGAKDVKPGDATKLSYFYHPSGWAGNVNEFKTDSTTHQGRPGAPQAQAQKVSSAKTQNATHASYNDKLNKQLDEIHARNKKQQADITAKGRVDLENIMKGMPGYGYFHNSANDDNDEPFFPAKKDGDK